MIKRYIKKPVQIEAIQWDGTNTAELMRFSRDIRFIYHDEGENSISTELYIQTPEGDLYPKIGDYLIKESIPRGKTIVKFFVTSCRVVP